MENDDSYDELKRDAKTCLSLMSQGLLYSEQIPLVLGVLREVSRRGGPVGLLVAVVCCVCGTS